MSSFPTVFETDLSRLKMLDPAFAAVTAIAARNGPASFGQVGPSLRSLSSKVDWSAALNDAVKSKLLVVKGKQYQLSKTGRTTLNRTFPNGIDNAPWTKIREQYLPLLVLGIEGASMSSFLGRGSKNLEGAAIVRFYDLPVPIERATIPNVRTALLWKLIRIRFPEFDIKLSGQEGAISDPFSKRLLSLAAGLGATDIAKATKVLACRPLGIKETPNLKNLRKALCTRGLEDCASTDASDPELHEFAKRVQELADSLTLPPFSNEVSIAQVYDAFGRQFADAGRLDNFKKRLVDAQKKELVELRPLDSPAMMDSDIRSRSEITRGSAKFHFIKKS